MERKIAKLERDMLRRVSQLLYEVADPIVQQGMVSVSKTLISKDLRVLRVWVTVNQDEEGQRAVMESLKKATRFIRGRLGENLDLRFTPEIRFQLDDSPERAARIDAILKELPHDELETPPGDASAVGGRASDGGDDTGDEDPDSDTSEDIESGDTGSDR